MGRTRREGGTEGRTGVHTKGRDKGSEGNGQTRMEGRERTRGYEGREGEYEGRAGDGRNSNANAQTHNAEHEETKRNEMTHPLAPHPRIGTHPSACIPTPSPVAITISILTPTPHPLHHRDATTRTSLRTDADADTDGAPDRPLPIHATNERTNAREARVGEC